MEIENETTESQSRNAAKIAGLAAAIALTGVLVHRGVYAVARKLKKSKPEPEHFAEKPEIVS